MAPADPALLYNASQQRIIKAAAELFAEHGVGGTSLQMIADAVGVTKAAVYHQFPAKDEIVLAVAQAELANLEDAIAAAEGESDPDRARRVLVERMVELAVQRRRMESTLVGDPVIVRFFTQHAPYRQVMDRLYRTLAGPSATADDRISAAMFTAAIGGAVIHPLVADLDDATLRAHLLSLARRFLDLPG